MHPMTKWPRVLAVATVLFAGAAEARPAAPPLATEERDIKIGATESLHVKIVGDLKAGPPLIVIPGGPGYSHHYIDALDKLATAKRAVVTVDPRGSGKSTRPKSLAWTLDDYNADFEALRAGLGVDKIHLAGHSYGGLFAMSYATAHPEHIVSLLLLDSIPPTGKALGTAIERYMKIQGQLTAKGIVSKEMLKCEGLDCTKRETDWAPVWYFNPKHPKAKDLLGTTCNDVSEPNDKGVGDYDLGAKLATFKAPTLVLSAQVPFGYPMGDEIIAALKAVKPTKVHLEKCGHIHWSECPAAFFPKVETFLDKQK